MADVICVVRILGKVVTRFVIIRPGGWPSAPSVRDGCPEQLAALILRHVCAPLPASGLVTLAVPPGESRAHMCPTKGSFCPAFIAVSSLSTESLRN